MIEVAKTFRFEAAHTLLNHDGKCARPHGHSYRVEVAVSGVPKGATGESDEGMVVDFAEISRVWRERLADRLDHRDLNTVLDVPTTAENVALYIRKVYEDAGLATAVTVWETEGCRASAGYR